MTPFLIKVADISFSEFIESLSPNARKSFRKAIRINEDVKFECIDFDPGLVEDFMKLWEKQIVYGKRVEWPIGLSYLKYLAKKDKLLCFCARTKDTGDIICLQFIEYFNTYVNFGPPLYDKNLYLQRNIGKFMMLRTIEYSIDHPGIKWVDIGSWGNITWRDLVFCYKKGLVESYKWQFIPRFIKENPQLAEPLVVRANIINFKLYLGYEKNKAFETLHAVKWKIARFLYAHKGQRTEQLLNFFSK